MRNSIRGRAVVAAVALLTCASCAAMTATSDPAAESRIESRIDQLRRRQQDEQQRLADLQQQVSAAEADARRAQDDAARSRCQALVARIDAEVTIKRAECARQIADFHACAARNDASRANTGILGCLLGLGAALASFGAALPLTAAGCGAGLAVGEFRTRECGEAPACVRSIQQVEAQVLQANGLTARPVCLPAPAQQHPTAPPVTVVPPDSPRPRP